MSKDRNWGGSRPKSRPDDKRGGARGNSGPKLVWFRMRLGQRVNVTRMNQLEEWELVRNVDGEFEFCTPNGNVVLGRPFGDNEQK